MVITVMRLAPARRHMDDRVASRSESGRMTSR